jgi:hypothetical protein
MPFFCCLPLSLFRVDTCTVPYAPIADFRNVFSSHPDDAHRSNSVPHIFLINLHKLLVSSPFSQRHPQRQQRMSVTKAFPCRSRKNRCTRFIRCRNSISSASRCRDTLSKAKDCEIQIFSSFLHTHTLKAEDKSL